ncbi:unnamed protein product [Closterium sp. NIES-53]
MSRPFLSCLLACLVMDPHAFSLYVSALTSVVASFAATRRLDYATPDALKGVAREAVAAPSACTRSPSAPRSTPHAQSASRSRPAPRSPHLLPSLVAPSTAPTTVFLYQSGGEGGGAAGMEVAVVGWRLVGGRFREWHQQPPSHLIPSHISPARVAARVMHGPVLLPVSYPCTHVLPLLHVPFPCSRVLPVAARPMSVIPCSACAARSCCLCYLFPSPVLAALLSFP